MSACVPRSGSTVARWGDVEADAPDLAARARAYLDAHTHKTIATIRRDGSPRISGTECLFVDGDLWFGSMFRATKALDLLREPRFALHSGSDDPATWGGDAKVAGTAEEVTDPARIDAVLTQRPEGLLHLFRAEIAELVVVSLNDTRDRMVVEAWHEGRGISRHER
jgi:hypothetical protein